MKSTVENLEPTKAKLTVEVDYAELEPFMAEAYKDIASQVNIPGFRKGHVPPRIIDQRFGRGVVVEQVVNETLPGFLSDAVVENKLRPLAQPEVEVVEVPEKDGSLVFTATMDIVPEFELPNLVGRELQVPEVEVTEEDIQVELDELRSRFASLKTLDRPAQDGDFLTLDLVATVDGTEIDSLSDVSYELGSESMLEGQDEALRGVEAGEDVEFKSEIRGGEYAGSDATINVTVSSVKERELPEVDEDFAMMVSEFDTVEELTEDLEKQVRRSKLGQQAVEARDLLLEDLLTEVEILLPESVVEAEVARRLSEDAEEEEKTEATKDVEASLRKQIFLDTLAEERNVQVEQKELFDFMMHISQSLGLDLGAMLQDQAQVQNLYGELARTKSLVSVLGETKVTDSTGAELDLSEFTADPSAPQEAGGLVDEDGAFAIDIDDLSDGDADVVIDAE